MLASNRGELNIAVGNENLFSVSPQRKRGLYAFRSRPVEVVSRLQQSGASVPTANVASSVCAGPCIASGVDGVGAGYREGGRFCARIRIESLPSFGRRGLVGGFSRSWFGVNLSHRDADRFGCTSRVRRRLASGSGLVAPGHGVWPQVGCLGALLVCDFRWCCALVLVGQGWN